MPEKLSIIRHFLHSVPELSGKERETARYLTKILAETNPNELWTEVGGTGVVAIYQGNQPGKVIGIRADLDALPIQESGNLPYKSKNKGIAHSCGHDGHMAIVAGVAYYISQRRDSLAGTVIVIFQPEEETGTGAAKMLTDQRMRSIRFDAVLALHNLPGFEKHSLIVREGAFTSNTTGMIIRLHGATSHAGHPENGNSPVMAMTGLINSLNSLPQTCVPIHRSALVTIVHARLGERAFGTTPGYAHIMLTMRAHEATDLEAMKNKATVIIRNSAEAYNLREEIEFVEDYPAMINDEELTKILVTIGEKLDLPIICREHPFSWSEDFSRFAQRAPGLLIGLGSGIDSPQLHNANYDFPDELLETGYRIFIEMINLLTGIL